MPAEETFFDSDEIQYPACGEINTDLHEYFERAGGSLTRAMDCENGGRKLSLTMDIPITYTLRLEQSDEDL